MLQYSRDRHCREIAEDIRDIFQEGLVIGPRESHFIQSTMPLETLHEIGGLIQDPACNACDPLIELIYFPDENIQIGLEDRIESARFEDRDRPVILEHLTARQTFTRLRFANLNETLKIPTPRQGVEAFVTRLNITRNLDPELIRTIGGCVAPDLVRRFKVWIRNMTREPGPRDTRFLKDLFVEMAGGHTEFENLLSFSLRFLEETPVDVEILEALIQHKQRCLQHIQRLERFETKRREHNFETLAAFGVREPHNDKQALMVKVALMDEIGLALFNQRL